MKRVELFYKLDVTVAKSGEIDVEEKDIVFSDDFDRVFIDGEEYMFLEIGEEMLIVGFEPKKRNTPEDYFFRRLGRLIFKLKKRERISVERGIRLQSMSEEYRRVILRNDALLKTVDSFTTASLLRRILYAITGSVKWLT